MDEYDVLGGYVPSFVQHLNDTRARLGLQVNGGGTDRTANPSAWTPAERNAFFRAVSVHSRWRPDLIAACVPTRTEWEVWMYLDALEEGAVALTMEQDNENVEMARGSEDECLDEGVEADDLDFDSDSDSEEDEDEDEDVCEPALEVSQAWIDMEERMATWIVQEECLVTVDVANAENVADEPPKRKRGRPRSSKRGCSQGRAIAEEGRGSPALPVQKREALMGRLEVPHLLVLDGILREGEERMKEKSKSRESSVTGATLTVLGDEEELYDGSPGPQAESDMVIDPILLAISGHAEPPGQGSTSSAPTPDVIQDLPSSDGEPFWAGHVFSFLPVEPNPDVIATAEPDMSSFSPRSRRRIQKRLYMRRKRGSEGVVDTRIEKLRPGKKAKLEQSETPAQTPLDPEGEVAEKYTKKNKGGLTLPYKLKAQFSELGIDAAYLGSEGMDLLNLGALGRLMGLASCEEDASLMVRSIDAQLIRHLQAGMVSFVTDIVHRAIVWREREIRMKQRSRVWRQGDQMTLAAIEHAVAAVGARYHSHKEYFKSLCVPTNDPGVNATDQSVDLSRLSVHREVYAPLVRPPLGYHIGLGCLARTYEREGTRRRRGPSAEMADELMSDETDEEALEGELTLEAVADKLDVALAERAEEALWAGVRNQ